MKKKKKKKEKKKEAKYLLKYKVCGKANNLFFQCCHVFLTCNVHRIWPVTGLELDACSMGTCHVERLGTSAE